MSLTVSIDAMGGDSAPEMVIEGVNMALKSPRVVHFLLYGDEERLLPLLERFPKVKAMSTIRHTSEIVTNDEKPAVALRSGRNTSMRLAINAVRDGEAAGVVSAGNTGALMAMAKFALKTLPGIDRPAIASCLPTQKGRCVMLDLGANVSCDADNLIQFAVMGEVYARRVLGLKQPSIGILNVGAEHLKGNDSVRAAALALQETNLPIKFYGFVEGDDICAGTVDVVVTDGFTGNIALKTAEGMASMFGNFLKDSLKRSLMSRLGALLITPALSSFRQTVDPRRHNGAMLLGLNGICVKSHGGTDALGFANAIQVAIGLTSHGINEGIKEDYAHLSDTVNHSAEQVTS
jgi:phosphate acyltransferase